MKPLNLVVNGKSVKIGKIKHRNNLIKKLKNLGIHEGDTVRVMNNFGNGPLIVAKGNVRIALGRGMTLKIFVQEL